MPKRMPAPIWIEMRCVFCKATARLNAGAVPAGEHPMCQFCGGPLATVKAASKR